MKRSGGPELGVVLLTIVISRAPVFLAIAAYKAFFGVVASASTNSSGIEELRDDE